MTIEYQKDRQLLPQAAAIHGFTLVELMVVISIMAILATMAFPAFNEMMASSRLTSTANSFIISAQLARSEAIKRNLAVRFCRSADGQSCAASGGWEQGWIVFRDLNNNAIADADAGELIKYEPALPSGYRFRGDAYNLFFQPTGAGSTPANLVLCPPNQTSQRIITVSVTGRTSAKKVTNSSCP